MRYATMRKSVYMMNEARLVEREGHMDIVLYKCGRH